MKMKKLVIVLCMVLAALSLMGFKKKEKKEEDDWAVVWAYLDDTSINVGETTVAYAEISGNISSSRCELRWRSDNSGVASVSGSGVRGSIRGNSSGEAGIGVYLYVDGREYDNAWVYVNVKQNKPEHISVTGIDVRQKSANIPVGGSVDIEAHAQPYNANNRGISWSSNNTYVASVNENGTIFGLHPGSAVITARTNENGHHDEVYVTVSGYGGTEPVYSVWVNPSSVTLTQGQYTYITAEVSPANAVDRSVSWYSSNPGVAVVASNGQVTGVAPGSAVITCVTNSGGKQAQVYVNVVAGAAPAPAPAAPVPASQNAGTVAVSDTHNAVFLFNTTQAILVAGQRATVTIPASQPMAYDTNVAAALRMRPDVTLVAVFPFQGHNFSLKLPAGYNLAGHLEANGYCEWLTLCQLKDGPVCTMIN